MSTATAYVRTGRLTDAQTVRLSEPLPVTGGEVRVTLQITAPDVTPPKDSLMEYLEKLRVEQERRGHVPMSREEIDAYIKGERDSWGDD
jgi:hypothetical protein